MVNEQWTMINEKRDTKLPLHISPTLPLRGVRDGVGVAFLVGHEGLHWGVP